MDELIDFIIDELIDFIIDELVDLRQRIIPKLSRPLGVFLPLRPVKRRPDPLGNRPGPYTNV